MEKCLITRIKFASKEILRLLKCREILRGKIYKLSIIPPANIAHRPSTFIGRIKKAIHKRSTPNKCWDEVFISTKGTRKDGERTILLLQEIVYKVTSNANPLSPLMKRNPGITSDSQKNLATDS